MNITILGKPDLRYQAACDELAAGAATISFIPVLAITPLDRSLVPDHWAPQLQSPLIWQITDRTSQSPDYDALIVTSPSAAAVGTACCLC